MLKCNKCGSEDVYDGPSDEERGYLTGLCLDIERQLPGTLADWIYESQDDMGPCIDVYNVSDYDLFRSVVKQITIHLWDINKIPPMFISHTIEATKEYYTEEVEKIKAGRLQLKS